MKKNISLSDFEGKRKAVDRVAAILGRSDAVLRQIERNKMAQQVRPQQQESGNTEEVSQTEERPETDTPMVEQTEQTPTTMEENVPEDKSPQDEPVSQGMFATAIEELKSLIGMGKKDKEEMMKEHKKEIDSIKKDIKDSLS